MPRTDLLNKVKARAEEEDKILKWGDVKTDKFYEIISVSALFENKFGESCVITLEDLETDKKIHAFSTTCLPLKSS